jgi:hypothetical protein
MARPDHLSVSLLGFEVPKRSYYRARCYDAAAGRFLIEDSQDLNTEEPLATMGRTLELGRFA